MRSLHFFVPVAFGCRFTRGRAIPTCVALRDALFSHSRLKEFKWCCWFSESSGAVLYTSKLAPVCPLGLCRLPWVTLGLNNEADNPLFLSEENA